MTVDKFTHTINEYRKNKITLEPVIIYTDNDSGEKKQGSIRNSSAYNALISLLSDAGLVNKDKNYSSLKFSKINSIIEILEKT